jgi:hypothetical protein
MGRQNIANIRGPRGLSAYEIAVKNGYPGTEIEWITQQASGGLINPITHLPPPEIMEAMSAAVLKEHEADPTPHSAYDKIDMLTQYRFGKI